MLMCSVGARPLWRARWLLLFQHVVSMTPFFFFFLDWKKYLYRSLLPQTEPTAEWNKPVLPSLWAARVTLGNVGNHRLNIKYWVVVRKKKKYSGFHRWNVSSRGIKSLFFLLKITTRRKKKNCSFFSAPASVQLSQHIGSLSWSGSARSFKDSAVGESERKKVGGRGSRRRGGVHRRTSEGEGSWAEVWWLERRTIQNVFTDTPVCSCRTRGACRSTITKLDPTVGLFFRLTFWYF